MTKSHLDRYHHLLNDYREHGDENRLRAVVAMSQENALSLETTSGRLAASMSAVLDAYDRIGARRLDLAIDRVSESAAPDSANTENDPESGDANRIQLETPEKEEHVVVEIRGERSGQALPVVRLDYVVRQDEDALQADKPLGNPIQPRQLFDVLTGLLEPAGGLRGVPQHS